jgi:hypothetical protein
MDVTTKYGKRKPPKYGWARTQKRRSLSRSDFSGGVIQRPCVSGATDESYFGVLFTRTSVFFSPVLQGPYPPVLLTPKAKTVFDSYF